MLRRVGPTGARTGYQRCAGVVSCIRWEGSHCCRATGNQSIVYPISRRSGSVHSFWQLLLATCPPRQSRILPRVSASDGLLSSDIGGSGHRLPCFPVRHFFGGLMGGSCPARRRSRAGSRAAPGGVPRGGRFNSPNRARHAVGPAGESWVRAFWPVSAIFVGKPGARPLCASGFFSERLPDAREFRRSRRIPEENRH
jgi:hypothetical protein